MVLFLTAHLPEGFPRVSQPQAGSKQTLRHTFISAVFASYSLPLPPSYACMVFLLHFLQKCICSFTIPFPSHSHAVFWVNFRGSLSLLTFSYKCATSVYIVLYLYAETKTQSSKACHHRSGSVFFVFFVRQVFRYVTSPHITSLAQKRQEQNRTSFKSVQVLVSILDLIRGRPLCHFQSNLSAVDDNMLLMLI